MTSLYKNTQGVSAALSDAKSKVKNSDILPLSNALETSKKVPNSCAFCYFYKVAHSKISPPSQEEVGLLSCVVKL